MNTDAIGQRHARAGDDARIVSLVPSITELLFALGLGERVVGRTGFCVHPREQVRAVPKLGGTKDVDLEALRALEPSHVVVNIDENTRETFDALAGFVPHVIVTHPNAPEDNLALYELLGGIFGAEAAAARLAAAFRGALARLHARVDGLAPRRVLYLIWREPWMTIAPDTYIARTLALAKLECVAVAPAGRYPTITAADTRAANADLVLLSSEPYPFRERHLGEARGLAGERAQARLVDGEMVSWYGSRAIAGLDYLAAFARELEAATA